MNETIEKLMAEIDRCEEEMKKALDTYTEYTAILKGLHLVLINIDKGNIQESSIGELIK